MTQHLAPVDANRVGMECPMKRDEDEARQIAGDLGLGFLFLVAGAFGLAFLVYALKVIS